MSGSQPAQDVYGLWSNTLYIVLAALAGVSIPSGRLDGMAF